MAIRPLQIKDWRLNQESPNYQLPITNYQLPITNYQLLMAFMNGTGAKVGYNLA